MANGNPLNNLEHNNLSPKEYSVPQERAIYPAYSAGEIHTFSKQTYLRTEYNPFKYDNYAGTVYIAPPNPIYLPKINVYNGIAPMRLQPSINPLYPWENFYE